MFQIPTRLLPLLAVGEVEVPPAVVPFERYLTPSEWNLGVRVERANVGPCTGRVLLGVRQSGVIRATCVAGPSVARHVRLVVAHARGTGGALSLRSHGSHSPSATHCWGHSGTVASTLHALWHGASGTTTHWPRHSTAGHPCDGCWRCNRRGHW